VPRLDDNEIGIQPPDMGYRILKRNEYVECAGDAQEADVSPPLRCAPGQVLQGGACVGPPPSIREEEPAPSDRTFGIAGSNPTGAKLMPALIKASGRSQGFATEGEACADTTFSLRKGPWALSIACSARGSHTGIPALAAGDVDI